MPAFGVITTPFDTGVPNDMDRFYLVHAAIDRLPPFGATAAYPKQELRDKLLDCREYVDAHGRDMPEVRDRKSEPFRFETVPHRSPASWTSSKSPPGWQGCFSQRSC